MTAFIVYDSPRRDELRRRFWKETRGGLVIGLLFFGLLGGWAAAAPLASAVVAPGTVVVSGARRVVQHKDGGVVGRIFVVEGQRVEAGEILVELDDSDVAATSDVLFSQYVSLASRLARLEAERAGADPLAEPAGFAALEGEDRAAAERAMASQRELAAARSARLASEIEVLDRRIEQLRAQIRGLEAQIGSHDRQFELISEELEGVRSLNERGLTPTTRVRELERGLAEIEGDRAQFAADIARVGEEIGEAEIERLRVRRAREEEIAAEIQEAEQALGAVAPQLEAARSELERTLVRAPVTGQVVGLKTRTESGVVAPGEILMEIVPEDQPLVVQARIKPTDVGVLREGARAQIRLTAFSHAEAPLLYGELSLVTADRMTDERTGAPYYLAEAMIPPEELEKVDAIREGQAELRAGMPADIVIPTRSRTALSYLMEPLTDRMWRSFRE